MSLKELELIIDKETFDNSNLKRGFIEVYHQQGANLNNPDKKKSLFSLKITIIIKKVMHIFNMK